MSLSVLTRPEHLEALAGLVGEPAIALDIETAGADGLNPYQSRIRLIQLATPSDVFVVDCDAVDPFPFLKPILTDPTVTKVIHNAKFDLKHIYHHTHIEVKPVFCTYLASQLLAMGDREKRHSLEAVALRYLDLVLDKHLQTSDWSGLLHDDQIEYAARDVSSLMQLYPILDSELRQNKLRRVSQLEFRTVMPVAAMELKGMRLDMDRWQTLETKLTHSADELESQIYRYLRRSDDLPGINTLNLNAPDQVREALLELGIDVPGTSENHLKRHLGDHPVIKMLLDYRHLTRILSSTVRHAQNAIEPATGRVHPSYHQIASASGRFACSEPNIQQVPREKEVRAAFIPDDGYAFVIADYSQVELRVAAGLAKDPIMLKAYEAGEDLHRLTAALTMDKPKQDVSKNERQAAKAINFGLIYAMGPNGLMQSAANSYGVEMTLEQATTFRDRYFNHYAGIKRWQEQLAEIGKRQRYVRTCAGRIRQYKQRDDIRVTELFNIPVQGTAAEGLKSAMCLFWDRVQEAGLDAAIIAIIHDEIIVEVVTGQAQQACDLLKQCMVEGISWLVPNVVFDVDAHIGTSWADKS
ncbi:MAG: bifunctional 3'-5' exonuclease/DNA polymerase [Acidobacteria bacterium]|nr:bifunctional 3'-5' exonuclease/DNA polymerase [Acidobacteriota bacterium]